MFFKFIYFIYLKLLFFLKVTVRFKVFFVLFFSILSRWITMTILCLLSLAAVFVLGGFSLTFCRLYKCSPSLQGVGLFHIPIFGFELLSRTWFSSLNIVESFPALLLWFVQKIGSSVQSKSSEGSAAGESSWRLCLITSCWLCCFPLTVPWKCVYRFDIHISNVYIHLKICYVSDNDNWLSPFISSFLKINISDTLPGIV